VRKQEELEFLEANQQNPNPLLEDQKKASQEHDSESEEERDP